MSLSKKDRFNYLYYLKRNKLPNYKNPTNISEYILSQSLKGLINQYYDYADKYKVRSYIENKGLKETLPNLYGVYNKSSEIDYNIFPEKFVLKTNNGCGTNIICMDNNLINKDDYSKKLNNWLKTTYYKYEDHYNLIVPKIICEEFIEDYFGNKIPIDYKFMCYNGKVKLILICLNRSEFGGNADSYIYDLEWKFRPDFHYNKKNNPEIFRPFFLDEMIDKAEMIANDFNFVRVDFYYSKRGMIFSELTFTPGMGILPTFSTKALEYIYN